jgi:uncharacterized protein (DUF2252 family)
MRVAGARHEGVSSVATVTYRTPGERAELGRAARAAVPRSSHAAYSPAANRPDPVALLEGQARTRIPELVPIRYGRMLSSPFAFYRGASLVMAADLASTPASGIDVQLCGDAHLSNFGVFGSPERQLVFDLNDFDETLPGPWEWDVKRLAASLVIAGRNNGFTEAQNRTTVLACSAEYRRAMAEFAAMRSLEVWYAYIAVDRLMADVADGMSAGVKRRTEKILAKARSRDHLQAFSKLVTTVDGEPRFVSDPPLLVPVADLPSDDTAHLLEHRVRDALRGYRSSLQSDRRHLLDEFRFVELARKVVGVGSVGTRAWVALMLGRDAADPLILQIKEADPSSLAGFTRRSAYANQGQRVVAGQRLMQASSDIFLGWHHFTDLDGTGRDCYFRQLRDWKGSVEVDQMPAETMTAYARLCAWTLARAHARSGDRIAIAAYLGTGPVFDAALADFATAYADQNARDFAALQAAAADGTIVADQRW